MSVYFETFHHSTPLTSCQYHRIWCGNQLYWLLDINRNLQTHKIWLCPSYIAGKQGGCIFGWREGEEIIRIETSKDKMQWLHPSGCLANLFSEAGSPNFAMLAPLVMVIDVIKCWVAEFRHYFLFLIQKLRYMYNKCQHLYTAWCYNFALFSLPAFANIISRKTDSVVLRFRHLRQ